MVLLEAGKLQHKKFVSIWGLPELKGIEVTPEAITLGALTTYTDVARHPLLREEFRYWRRRQARPAESPRKNRGTLGGNIVNASPAADSPPALLVYDAELEAGFRDGARAGFHIGHSIPGYKQMILRPDELVARIRLPRDASGVAILPRSDA